jgi:hypothetical protein
LCSLADLLVYSGSRNSFEEPFVAAVVRFLRLPQQTAAGDDLMADRTRVHELDTVIEARRGWAAELRVLADRLDSQEPDYSALHDAWEVLVDLGDQVDSLRVQFFNRYPEQKAWLIEQRPWFDPKLELIGKPSRSPRSRAARPRRKQKAAQISV